MGVTRPRSILDTTLPTKSAYRHAAPTLRVERRVKDKIGYDVTNDDDIDDPTDDLVWDEDFGSTSKTPAYDP